MKVQFYRLDNVWNLLYNIGKGLMSPNVSTSKNILKIFEIIDLFQLTALIRKLYLVLFSRQ